MTKRLFWFLLGALTAIFGLNYLKKKAQSTADRFSPENIADTLTDVAMSVKDYAVGLWQGVVSGERLDDEKLTQIFDNADSPSEPRRSPTDTSR